MNDMILAVTVTDLIVVYLLLLGAARLYGGRCDHLRIFMAALTAAVHCGAVASGELSFLHQYWGRKAVLCISGLIAFGWSKDSVRKISFFILLDAALEGILNGHRIASVFQRLLITVLIAMLCCLSRKTGRVGKTYAHIEIRHRDKSVRLDALRDTGNDLIDIVTGAPVVVVGPAEPR